MKKEYAYPIFEVIKIQLSNELLGPSTSQFEPEDPVEEEVEQG